MSSRQVMSIPQFISVVKAAVKDPNYPKYENTPEVRRIFLEVFMENGENEESAQELCDSTLRLISSTINNLFKINCHGWQALKRYLEDQKILPDSV